MFLEVFGSKFLSLVSLEVLYIQIGFSPLSVEFRTRKIETAILYRKFALFTRNKWKTHAVLAYRAVRECCKELSQTFFIKTHIVWSLFVLYCNFRLQCIIPFFLIIHIYKIAIVRYIRRNIHIEFEVRLLFLRIFLYICYCRLFRASNEEINTFSTFCHRLKHKISSIYAHLRSTVIIQISYLRTYNLILVSMLILYVHFFTYKDVT